jgi:hypothetical protein
MIFSLLSTKHAALCTNYNTKITQHKHTIQYKHNQTRQTFEKCLFNNLDFSRYCDGRDMAKGLWIVRYGFKSLVGKKIIMIGKNWTKQDIMEVVFMIY